MRRAAFSLLEVMLAIGITLLLAGSVFGFMWNLLDRREVLAKAAADAQAVGAFIERLEGDLLCALAGDDGRGAGIRGDQTGIVVLTRGVSFTDALDLRGTRYRFDQESRVLSAGPWSPGPEVQDEGAEGEAGGLEAVRGGLGRVRFRYHDGAAWRSGFDSLESGALPAAVEVAVWIANDPRLGTGEVSEREPDRLRVIVVPDGPRTAWRSR